jgi:hypothetical protein
LQHELSQWCWMVFGLHRSLTSEERFDETRHLLRITTESMAATWAGRDMTRHTRRAVARLYRLFAQDLEAIGDLDLADIARASAEMLNRQRSPC